MYAIVVDRDAVSLSEHMCDRSGSLFVEIMKIEYLLDDVGWMLGIWPPPWCLDGGNHFGFSVFLGELLDVTTTDVVSLGDIFCVEVVIDNESTDVGDIILFQLHLPTTIEGAIASTKSFPRLYISNQVDKVLIGLSNIGQT